MNQITKLDRLVHEPLRFAIVNALTVSRSLTFNDLKRLTQATDGNLSVQSRRLEEGGYIKCSKSFEGRITKTKYKLTAKGTRAVDNYFIQLETLVSSHRLNAIGRTVKKGIVESTKL